MRIHNLYEDENYESHARHRTEWSEERNFSKYQPGLLANGIIFREIVWRLRPRRHPPSPFIHLSSWMLVKNHGYDGEAREIKAGKSSGRRFDRQRSSFKITRRTAVLFFIPIDERNNSPEKDPSWRNN